MASSSGEPSIQAPRATTQPTKQPRCWTSVCRAGRLLSLAPESPGREYLDHQGFSDEKSDISQDYLGAVWYTGCIDPFCRWVKKDFHILCW